jgi:hypothetical protein
VEPVSVEGLGLDAGETTRLVRKANKLESTGGGQCRDAERDELGPATFGESTGRKNNVRVAWKVRLEGNRRPRRWEMFIA